jgi:hypothetical protein
MSTRPYKLVLVGVATVLLVAASFLQRQLNRQRADLGLTRIAPLENAPPVLAFTTVALGGFRGLIANALWIRANDLQMEDRFFEQVQLADWITKLEPTFTQVWLVQGWNMAYNISVKFRDPYDRWRWVQRGIELLRDEGLKYNPREALIYRELAWFFQHKMGQNLDDAHLIYKYEWANEMTRALGGGRPNYEELLNPTTDEARERVRLLREKYKMDPAVMKRADELYGPLEWRLPEASAIYWAMVGLEKSNKKDLITLRRVIYQSLHVCVLRGRIVLAHTNGTYVFGPDLSKIALAHDGYEKMLAEETEMPHAIVKAHRNFLKEAVYLLYTHNRLAEANRWMTVLKQKYPEAVPPDQSVETYALKRMTENITELNHNRVKAMLEGFIRQHFEHLAIDDDERAAGFLLRARSLWAFYDSSIQNRREQLRMESIEDMYRRILDDMLDPQTGIASGYAARLRTKLNLPAPVAPKTNLPPVAPKQP